ncbi:MAG: histidinol-phosphate transaminase [candidate division NC10 bacterium]|nr:histidinol-phosphate transaminase [candidate division NC10 bacterium]
MPRNIEELALPYLKHITPYKPGKPIEEVEREYGIKDSVKLASNENPLGPSPLALQALREAIEGINRYPDGGGYYLKQALAKKHGVEPENLVLGNGSNEVIELAARTFLSPQDEVVMADPAFLIYRLVTAALGCCQIMVPLKDFRHDLKAMAEAVSPRTKMVFVGNPNNPTGTAVEPEELETFISSLPEDVVLVLDEAYYEYLPIDARPDAIKHVREGRLILCLRTFSKIYGLAGLRIGYGIAPPGVVEAMNKIRQPFNVNSLAQKAALASLEDRQHLESTRAINEAGKRYLYEKFQEMGLVYVPTAANFILVDVGRDGEEVARALLPKGVIVRPMGGYHLPTHFRVTIGTPPENERFIQSLKEALAFSR